MTSWTHADLDLISSNADLFVSPLRDDGVTYVNLTQTWALVVDDQVFAARYQREAGPLAARTITQGAGPRSATVLIEPR